MKTKNLEITKESISIRAYEIYLKGGCQDGHAEEHWLRAEAELQGACLPTEPALVKKPTAQKVALSPKKKTSIASKPQVTLQQGPESH